MRCAINKIIFDFSDPFEKHSGAKDTDKGTESRDETKKIQILLSSANGSRGRHQSGDHSLQFNYSPASLFQKKKKNIFRV